jgi:hypothetical protein
MGCKAVGGEEHLLVEASYRGGLLILPHRIVGFLPVIDAAFQRIV